LAHPFQNMEEIRFCSRFIRFWNIPKSGC